jgi:hypothetical protein
VGCNTPAVIVEAFTLIQVHLSKFKFKTFNFLQICQMPLVKEFGNMVYK